MMDRHNKGIIKTQKRHKNELTRDNIIRYYNPIEKNNGNANNDFSTGSVRKNASKKIAAILDMATDIQFSAYHFSCYSDCYVYADAVSKSVEFVTEWMKENYSDLSVYLICDGNGQPKELKVSAFGGYFTITFASVEKKEKVTFEQVTEALSQGYVSPLNSDDKIEISETNENAKERIAFANYLELLIDEKGVDIDRAMKVEGNFGFTYRMLISSLIDMNIETQEQIKSKLVEIDFKNGDIFKFLNYLAAGLLSSAQLH